ncbi:MAG: PDZ domain-containing protein [Halioglobus sp.]|nr:PDZ domain-containing protein [Halioglobus sp.]
MNHALPSRADPQRQDVDRPAALGLDATPLFWVWTVVVMGMAFFVVQTMLATRAPTLGIEFVAVEGDAGLQITRVYPGLPADRAGLEVGDVIVALADPESGRKIVLRDHLALKDPDMTGDYATVNAFQRDVRNLSALLSSGPVTVSLAGGSALELTARERRPLNLLPGWYWAISLMGIVALAIGVALKAHTPGNPNTTLVLVAAIGFWLTAWTWPLYGTKELAAPLPGLVPALESINHLGFVVMIGAAMALLWQYPVRLGRRDIWPLTIGVGLVLWCVMTFQLYEFPVHAFYFPLFCMPVVVGAVLAGTQWRLSRGRPVEKASLRWLLITIFGSTWGAFIVYAVPPLYGREPLTPPWASQLVLLVFFLGLALGAARYRLFDVERWWVNTWLWFGAGAAIVLIDVALITLLELGAASSTVLAVVVVAWCYFPLRQRLWERVARGPDRSPWHIMPQIASRFARPLDTSQVTAELGDLFESIFDTPDAVVLQTSSPNDRPRLTNHGLNLVIPGPHGAGQVLLSGKHRGRRLFDRADVEYAHTVVTLVGQLVELAREHEGVERTERERIMRDLHDDVGARLLSLMHGTDDPAVREEAADLLQTLRTSVIPLHNRRAMPLADAASKWRVELEQRAARAGARLQWREAPAGAVRLSARQYVNLTRILRELLTNALKHARPENVWISLEARDDLVITFSHDGSVTDPREWSRGRGQHNLATRAGEIDGKLEFALVGDPPDRRLRARLEMKL